jgi:hypothetical protein
MSNYEAISRPEIDNYLLYVMVLPVLRNILNMTITPINAQAMLLSYNTLLKLLYLV